ALRELVARLEKERDAEKASVASREHELRDLLRAERAQAAKAESLQISELAARRAAQELQVKNDELTRMLSARELELRQASALSGQGKAGEMRAQAEIDEIRGQLAAAMRREHALKSELLAAAAEKRQLSAASRDAEALRALVKEKEAALSAAEREVARVVPALVARDQTIADLNANKARLDMDWRERMQSMRMEFEYKIEELEEKLYVGPLGWLRRKLTGRD
ncbi:MAG: hypothetical protein HYZ74_08725, partial [Elusimicrobia bacterium]|nr:hypothetical protein [Elusimicrobiota bacterium]